MSYCMAHTIVKAAGDKAVAHPLRCRCWSCQHCRPWRAAQLVREAKAGKPRRFVTLTSNPSWGPSKTYRARKLIEAWRIIVRQYRAHFKTSKIQYFIVMETTKTGEPHLHILVRGPYLSQKWLSKRMQELARAPIVDVRYVRSAKKAAEYVSKYVGKAPKQFDGCKRYWRSMDYMHPTRAEIKAQRAPDTTFYFIRQDFATYTKALGSYGITPSAANAYTFAFTLMAGERAPPGCRNPARPG